MEPKHGEERNRRRETTAIGENHALLDEQSGEIIYEGPLSWSTTTVSERWCEVCKEWVECRGIFAHIICPTCHTEWDAKIQA